MYSTAVINGEVFQSKEEFAKRKIPLKSPYAQRLYNEKYGRRNRESREGK